MLGEFSTINNTNYFSGKNYHHKSQQRVLALQHILPKKISEEDNDQHLQTSSCSINSII
jgi:hypothetical protein